MTLIFSQIGNLPLHTAMRRILRGVVFVIITTREVPVNVRADQAGELRGLQEAE